MMCKSCFYLCQKEFLTAQEFEVLLNCRCMSKNSKPTYYQLKNYYKKEII